MAFWPTPAVAVDLFARHTVSVSFATTDGKPLADAEVRVFAPGQKTVARTGRTDKEGKFEFSASEDGFWTAEARSGDEIARATVRVGKPGENQEPLSPEWVIVSLMLMVAVAFGLRFARNRLLNRRSR
jgi:hypothetical protein